jgi:hypothetical protein
MRLDITIWPGGMMIAAVVILLAAKFLGRVYHAAPTR